MLKNYIKIAFKVFLRRKFFTFISLFAISFTLVVLMTFVAMLDGVFGKHPPENKHERMLANYEVQLIGDDTMSSSRGGYKLIDSYLRNIGGVERMSLEATSQLIAYHKGEKINLWVKRTDDQFWKIFDLTFLEGQPFTSDDEKNANFVAVINESTHNRFFGNESAINKTIEVDGQQFRIIGVVADVSIMRMLPFADLWAPISTMKGNAYKDQLHGHFSAVFLAKSTNDLPGIKDEFKARLKKVEIPKDYKFINAAAETFFEKTSRDLYRELINRDRNDYRSRETLLLTLIIGLIILFMIVPTINLVNINTSRIMERSSEIGVRKAFGASSKTLIWQFIVENLLLTLIGGAIGFILSKIVLRLISESGLIPYTQFNLNYRVFTYGLAITIFFGLLSGILPAWRMSRLQPIKALRGTVR